MVNERRCALIDELVLAVMKATRTRQNIKLATIWFDPDSVSFVWDGPPNTLGGTHYCHAVLIDQLGELRLGLSIEIIADRILQEVYSAYK